MSVAINNACVKCGACVWECPSGAISPGDPRPVVTAESCTECYGFFGESQCVVVCPADAIDVHAEPVEELARRFDVLHSGRAPQNTWIWTRVGVP
ncbi:4Fe-4S binding protein [Nonomuraea solani]|uniref:4Fe-4S binding protein n=1 Tax=Nonomuraea solani TaxID=1144553 RepID=UPI001357DC74|nr:4Fe-4S binding protein [Nonomuraea solani]